MADAFDPAFAGVVALGQAYRSGITTPLAVAEAAFSRIAAVEPRLNAVADLMRAPALASAAEATEELRSGRDRGPLHGIPVAIKDNVDVAGTATRYGTRAVPPAVAAVDAALVRHLRAAGAVPFTKTNLLEFAYGVAHPAVGKTSNPWDPGRTSGGSSGGSAALVAAGVVPLALGTDTGGSIRIPASYCGIVGVKPSFGLVPTDGVFALSPTLDHAGPLARSVADAAALLAGLVGRPLPLPEIPLAGMRIGLVVSHVDSPLVTPGVRAAVADATERLRRGGAELISVSIDGVEVANASLVAILLPEAALVHEGLRLARPTGYAPGTLQQLEAGRRASGIDYLRALRDRARIMEAVESAFGEVDVLLSPSVGFVAPIEDPAIEGGEGDGEMVSSGLANLTGHPALSLPCGMSEGLPVGLQLIGAAGRDAELMARAGAVERCLAFAGRPAI